MILCFQLSEAFHIAHVNIVSATTCISAVKVVVIMAMIEDTIILRRNFAPADAISRRHDVYVRAVDFRR